MLKRKTLVAKFLITGADSIPQAQAYILYNHKELRACEVPKVSE